MIIRTTDLQSNIWHSRQHNNLNELNETEVNQEKIGRVTKIKYLGLNINENLSWNDQYKKVKAMVKSGLSALQRLKDILPQSELAAVYRALIKSHLRYVIIIWSCISDTKLDNLQTLQSKSLLVLQNFSTARKSGNISWHTGRKKLFSMSRNVAAFSCCTNVTV